MRRGRKAGSVGVRSLRWTILGGMGAPGQPEVGSADSVPYHVYLLQGCTQPTLLALAIPGQPLSPKVSLCQVCRKESRWHHRIPSKAQAGWYLYVHVNVCFHASRPPSASN